MDIIGILKGVNDPGFLFLVMLATQFLSIWAQWFEAKKTGATMSFMELLTYWPQLVLGLAMSISAFVALYESGTLNFASAMGISAMVNKVSDLFASRRSKAIVDSIPSSTDHQARK